MSLLKRVMMRPTASCQGGRDFGWNGSSLGVVSKKLLGASMTPRIAPAWRAFEALLPMMTAATPIKKVKTAVARPMPAYMPICALSGTPIFQSAYSAYVNALRGVEGVLLPPHEGIGRCDLCTM